MTDTAIALGQRNLASSFRKPCLKYFPWLVFLLAALLPVPGHTLGITVQVDAGNDTETFDPLLHPGMELSQWGPTFVKPYFHTKYQEDVEFSGGLYRTGLNLSYQVAQTAESQEEYMTLLKTFDQVMLSYDNPDVTLVVTLVGTPKWLSPLCSLGNDSSYDCEADFYTSPPKDYQAWADLVQTIVSHYHDTLGLDPWFEVWNEPDLGYNMDDPTFWSGTRNELFKLYRYSVQGAQAANPDVIIGGPGVSVWDDSVLSDFISFVAQYDLPLHFLSWHLYVGWNNFWGSAEEYQEMATSIRGWLTAAGLDSQTPLVVDEWNYDGSLDDTLEHTTEHDSAYALYTLGNMDNSGLDRQSFFNFVDFDSNPLFSGSTGAMSNLGVIKSVFNAFKAISITEGLLEEEDAKRLEVNYDRDPCALTVFASLTQDQKTVRILAGNYIPTNAILKNTWSRSDLAACSDMYNRTDNSVTATVQLENLPFSGVLQRTVQRIDEDNANPCRYNKRTEAATTDLPCGQNGMVDSLVSDAGSDAKTGAYPYLEQYLTDAGYSEDQLDLLETNVFDPCLDILDNLELDHCLQQRIAPVAAQGCGGSAYPPDCATFTADMQGALAAYLAVYDDLFYFGTHQANGGQALTVDTWIDQINDLPEISLEGSAVTDQVTTTGNGYEMSIILPAYGVALIELTPIE